jgi:hypothetical protein
VPTRILIKTLKCGNDRAVLNLDFRIDQARVGGLDALEPPDARSKSWSYPECLHVGMVSNRWRLPLYRRPVIRLTFRQLESQCFW